jgi:hypothetical protein
LDIERVAPRTAIGAIGREVDDGEVEKIEVDGIELTICATE